MMSVFLVTLWDSVPMKAVPNPASGNKIPGDILLRVLCYMSWDSASWSGLPTANCSCKTLLNTIQLLGVRAGHKTSTLPSVIVLQAVLEWNGALHSQRRTNDRQILYQEDSPAPHLQRR